MRTRLVGTLLVSLCLLLLGGAFAGSVSAGGGCHGQRELAPSDGASSVVNIEACSFGPTVARVPVGTAVTFLNADRVPHNVVGVGTAWASPDDLQSGATFVHSFDAAGIYPYACSLHPGMNGAVVVGAADMALASSSTPVVTQPAPVGNPGAPVGLALAGAGGLVIGAAGAGLLFRRRADGAG